MLKPCVLPFADWLRGLFCWCVVVVISQIATVKNSPPNQPVAMNVRALFEVLSVRANRWVSIPSDWLSSTLPRYWTSSQRHKTFLSIRHHELVTTTSNRATLNWFQLVCGCRRSLLQRKSTNPTKARGIMFCHHNIVICGWRNANTGLSQFQIHFLFLVRGHSRC